MHRQRQRVVAVPLLRVLAGQKRQMQLLPLSPPALVRSWRSPPPSRRMRAPVHPTDEPGRAGAPRDVTRRRQRAAVGLQGPWVTTLDVGLSAGGQRRTNEDGAGGGREGQPAGGWTAPAGR